MCALDKSQNTNTYRNVWIIHFRIIRLPWIHQIPTSLQQTNTNIFREINNSNLERVRTHRFRIITNYCIKKMKKTRKKTSRLAESKREEISAKFRSMISQKFVFYWTTNPPSDYLKFQFNPDKTIRILSYTFLRIYQQPNGVVSKR